MDRFYIYVYESIIYRWLIVNKDHYAKKGIKLEIDSEDPQKLIFYYQNLKGIIQFWNQHHIIEETIINENNELLFYLHYTIINLAIAKKFIINFFRELVGRPQPKHIGMSCSCGITTSLFVEGLKKLSQILNLPYEFDVVPLHEIESLCHDYDVILLAPQVSYLEPQIKGICKNQCLVSTIDATTFATSHYQDALNEIKDILK